jgi:divalent metal cation (Fe/Co/Zn/Cd) transporter
MSGHHGHGIVEPAAIRTSAGAVNGVAAVGDVRARWLGHRLRADVDILVPPDVTVAAADAVAHEVEHHLHHGVEFLAEAIVHVEPATVPSLIE